MLGSTLSRRNAAAGGERAANIVNKRKGEGKGRGRGRGEKLELRLLCRRMVAITTERDLEKGGECCFFGERERRRGKEKEKRSL